MKNRQIMLFGGFALLSGCAQEQEPHTVYEFLDNPIMLEAALVRCGQNRDESRHDGECINARQAISVLEAKEERARKDEFEAESNRKREALRRTQQAAAEARRRTEEAGRLRKEAEYLAQFGETLPPDTVDDAVDESAANAPSVVIPEAENDGSTGTSGDSEPASDGGNAPAATTSPTNDLDAIRDELRQRAEESGS